jgi:hypothetical protein
MKRGIISLVFLLGVILTLPSISAGILIEQTEDVYNIGDELSVLVTLNPSTPVNDFLSVDLICGSTLEIYRNSFNLGSGDEREIGINVVLSNSLLGDLSGNCYLSASYGADSVDSQSFGISDEIEIDLDLSSIKFDPTEKVIIMGEALKANGQKVNGFIDISIDDIGVSLSKTVSEGTFSFNLTIPGDALAGNHVMKIKVYEEGSLDLISNEGYLEEVIEITQLLSELEISVEPLNVEPGEVFTYTITTLDQSSEVINEEISLSIFEPGDFIYLKKLANSGEDNTLEFGLNQTPGYWKIEAEIGDLKERKLFYLEEKEEVHISLINDTLIVTNIGNVPYKKAIEISIGSEVEIKQLDLNIGETVKFKLEAPDGNYLIQTNDGDETMNLGETFLTGRAISVGEIGEGFVTGFSNPIVWTLLGIIILLAIILIVVKKLKKKKLLKPDDKKAKSIVSEGKKEDASIIALKIKNRVMPNIPGINQALMVAKNENAKIYVDNNYRVIVFSHLLTKKGDNTTLVIRTAKKMNDILTNHNLKSKEKIEYGIGINSGKIISEIKDGKFKFASVGNIIGAAKGLSDSAKDNILISESTHNKTAGIIKSERSKINKNAWSIEKVPDREQHKDFINKFKKKSD